LKTTAEVALWAALMLERSAAIAVERGRKFEA
jgi:hypothetical protein